MVYLLTIDFDSLHQPRITKNLSPINELKGTELN